jgi:MFS-type transporter involved in bile tolerance (Atg22 family)
MKRCVSNKGLSSTLIAYFLYIDGVGAVISLATNYARNAGAGTTGMIFALLGDAARCRPLRDSFSKLSASSARSK